MFLQNCKMQVLKTTRVVYVFQVMDHKKQNVRFYSSSIVYLQYWSSEQICLELKVWTSSFLNIWSSRPRPKVSYKKCVLKIKILQNSLKNICAFLKISQMHLFVEHWRTATFEINSKNQNSSTGEDFRTSHSQIFFKIGFLKNFALITRKYLCWSILLIKLQAWIIESSF